MKPHIAKKDGRWAVWGHLTECPWQFPVTTAKTPHEAWVRFIRYTGAIPHA